MLQHKHIARSVSFARGDTSWQLCTGGAEKLLRIFDLQRPEAPPTGGRRGAPGALVLLPPLLSLLPLGPALGASGTAAACPTQIVNPCLLCLPCCACRAVPAVLCLPCCACCAAEFSKAHDNIRCTHWIGDNRLLLVSYLDKPNVE